jgi:glutamate synthase domain-containing protein 1/glutamate synthase domain-containing protein 3
MNTHLKVEKQEAEGGCGVIGVASNEKIAGKHLLIPLQQMSNRGNGKGGGIAAIGMDPNAFGVTQEILENNYLLAVAYLDQQCKEDVERHFIHPTFEVDHIFTMPHVSDFTSIPGIEIPPPEATIYFVRVKKEKIDLFQTKNAQLKWSQQRVEDEIVYQNSYQLNSHFYAASGDKKAFVLSHGKNLLVLKMVGYGNDVILYYQLENFKAHVWIGHHRYPTKGKVWHPGGAHPFVGLNEALVHNGDFANYFSLCESLSQRHIYPLFLTDTEVSVLIFDLFYRTYQYPLEYVIEAFAPTTERDFHLLPLEKQQIYQLLQKTHMHISPDGPWFFLIAQSLKDQQQKPIYRLLGITDTSMLRPQVFAIQNGPISIGLSSSEKQAIDACLKSLSDEGLCWSRADHYWSARGGSYTDGGAFSFTVEFDKDRKAVLSCTDKFGNLVNKNSLFPPSHSKDITSLSLPSSDLSLDDFFSWVKKNLPDWSYPQLNGFLEALINRPKVDQNYSFALTILTKLIDRYYAIGKKRRSCVLAYVDMAIEKLIDQIQQKPTLTYQYLSLNIPHSPTPENESMLVINAKGFPAEGQHSLALKIVEMANKGFKKFIVTHCHGQRFIGNGLGPNSRDIQIDVYGSSGDYAASGIDGAKIIIHGSGQDQLAQIMKDGTLIVYGDIGQTFMYGAKGGQAFIRGNAGGRPLINAVGKPRVVINGTCLDYLAESFMAGNPLKEGGFVIVNGITFNEQGEIIELDTPYPGNNLFSLASGGAIYIRDPLEKVSAEQLNGGTFDKMLHADWELILPYLEENAEYFDIPLSRLLEFEGKPLHYEHIYRKIRPSHLKVLQEEEAWVKGYV